MRCAVFVLIEYGCGKNLIQVRMAKPCRKSDTRQFSSRATPFPGLMPDGPQAPRWFALYTASRHEKRVAQHLSQREIEFYLPLYKSERKWSDGSRVTLDLPLFPGYLFIHIQRSERSRVLGVPGALAVVGGTGGEPAWLARRYD